MSYGYSLNKVMVRLCEQGSVEKMIYGFSLSMRDPKEGGQLTACSSLNRATYAQAKALHDKDQAPHW